tara:strand:- start:637 stop:885 length:249 start_codon:yes stop_codon:yes gene_type:complete
MKESLDSVKWYLSEESSVGFKVHFDIPYVPIYTVDSKLSKTCGQIEVQVHVTMMTRRIAVKLVLVPIELFIVEAIGVCFRTL